MSESITTKVKPRHIDIFAAAAELSPLPFFLCDAKAKVLAASRGAHNLLGKNKTLGVSSGKLQLSSRDIQQRLLEMIGRAIEGDAPDPRSSALIVKIPRESDALLTLMISAVPDYPAPPVAVYMHEPMFTARISESALCQLYELTPAEARVARIMVNGGSTHEIAEHNHTSVHTVRNQIKSVFAKTGATRQAELTILLLTGPAHTR